MIDRSPFSGAPPRGPPADPVPLCAPRDARVVWSDASQSWFPWLYLAHRVGQVPHLVTPLWTA